MCVFHVPPPCVHMAHVNHRIFLELWPTSHGRAEVPQGPSTKGNMRHLETFAPTAAAGQACSQSAYRCSN